DDEDADDEADDEAAESAGPSGPDPALCAERFAELQAFYDTAWDALEEHGAGHAKTEAAREAVARHVMRFKLSPKLVDEVTSNLRNRIAEIRDLERQALRICVADAGMPRAEFISKFLGAEADLELVGRLSKVKKPWAKAVAARK